MANTVKLKTSSVQGKVPTTSDLQISELAYNSYDGKLYAKKDNGTASIIEIGASAGAAGISSLNALTGSTQTFATGTTGSDFAISSSGTAHTFNIPDASSTARGLITTGTQTILGSKTIQSAAAGTAAFIAKGAASQTANIFELQNSSSAALAYFNSAGGIKFNGGVCSQGMTFDTRNYGSPYGVTGNNSLNGNSYQFAFYGSTNSNTMLCASTGIYSALTCANGSNEIFNVSQYGTSINPRSFEAWAVALTVNTNHGNPTTIANFYSNSVLKFAFSREGNLTASGTGTFNAPTAATKALIAKGAASQSANLFEAQNSAGAVLTYVTASGSLVVGASSYSMPDRSAVVFGSLQNGLGAKDSSDTSGAYYLVCRNSTDGIVGSITRVGTTNAVAYNTSSDYRLKDNISSMAGALDKAMQLNPVTYTWKDCGVTSQGFVAHELQEILPDAVHGEKDAVDVSGNPVYQGVDYGKLTPLLSAALKELGAKVVALEARLAAVEGSI